MKNYTSLQKMKASEVAASFTEEKVTQETFKEEVAKGALYKAFEVPKNAKMLKFRYYSPDGTLIEQNNVPFVYDGTGIDSVENYYLLTDLKSGITLESEGWSKEAQTVTAEKRFLWTYTKTTYTNKAYTCTQPCIIAVFGEQGERGAMYLGHYADNQSAYEANTPAVFTGDYYLNTTDSYLYEFNKEENVWRKISDINDYRYNQSINDIFAAIEDSTDVEKFIKAKKIWVQHLSAAVARVNQLYSNIITLAQGKDLDGNATGGIIKSSNYNGTIQNGKITKEGTAGWAVDHSGKAEFNNVTVRGTVDSSTIKGGTITIGKNFSVDENGTLVAKNGEFEGTVKAEAGNFNNCFINNCTIGELVNFYGNIYSGPLELTNETPTGSSTSFSSSDYLENLYFYVQGTLKGHNYTGVIDGKKFNILNVSYENSIRGGIEYESGSIRAYNNNDAVFSKDFGKTDSFIKIGISITITLSINSNAKTFKLSNLPTSTPAESGIIYVEKGYLRIKE